MTGRQFYQDLLKTPSPLKVHNEEKDSSRLVDFTYMACNPRHEMGNVRVGTGDVLGTATDTPSSDANLGVALGLFIEANQRSTPVSYAGVFTLLSAGTQVALVEFEVFAQSRLPKQVLALVVEHQWHINFLENVLVSSNEGILSPSSNQAFSTRWEGIPITQQANRVDVVLEINRILQLQDGEVVPNILQFEFWVDVNSSNVNILVLKWFVERINLPLAQTNFQIVWEKTINAVSYG